MKVLIDNGHGSDTPGKRSPDGRWFRHSGETLSGRTFERICIHPRNSGQIGGEAPLQFSPVGRENKLTRSLTGWKTRDFFENIHFYGGMSGISVIFAK